MAKVSSGYLPEKKSFGFSKEHIFLNLS